MARLSIRLLGPFQVTLEGELAVGFRSDKVRALLAYLCVELGRPHRREKLAGLLWPDWPERSARTNLRQALANLRQVIGDDAAAPPFLHISRQTIQFNPASDASVDVNTFATLTHVQSTLQRPSQETIERLEKAAALYRGEFLEGFSLPDSAPFEEWTLLQREQSHRLMIEALHDLIDAYAERGDLDRALERTWRVLELDPWREQAHRRAMRLLALTDQRSAALAQYERCRRVLDEELGVEPAEQTKVLYEAIRSGDLKAAEPRGAPACAPAGELPTSLIPFVGRERELAQLQPLLAEPTRRLITLVGPGGSGKTRLAVEAAKSVRDHFAHGVHFVSLAPVASVDGIVPAVARALGFCFSPAEGAEAHEPREQLLDHLRAKDLLLIMDNCEHLLEGARVITDVLRTAPQVNVLATSRARLNVRGERLFLVPGMDYPAPDVDAEARTTEPEDVGQRASQRTALWDRQYSAITLFLQGAHQVRPDFEATADDLEDIARVCHLVQGMPLGILLAAAWIEMLTPAEIAAEIKRSLDFLETGWRDVPQRQRSLRAVFDHSWSLLTEREQEAFRTLSVFRGGFTREAAEAVGASLRNLKGLVDRSLLQHPSRVGRYKVHELLRQYGAERLAASPAAQAAARERHSAYYTAALERFAVDLQGPRQRTAMAEMEADSENLRAAWSWAVEQEQVERLDRAMEGLARFYHRRGRYHDGEAAFRAAADRLNAGDVSVDKLRVAARALVWQAYFNRALGHRDVAVRLRQRSLALLEQPQVAGQDTRAERALLTQHMGRAVFLSDYEQAREFLQESLALYRGLDDPWRAAAALHSLGTAALFRGAYADARAAMEESLEISQVLGDQEGIAWSMADLTFVAIHQARFEEARRLARDARAMTQALGDREGIGFGLLAQGASLEYLGEFAEAYSAGEESLQVFEDLGRRGWIILAEAAVSSVSLHLGRYEDARAHGEASQALAEETGLQLRVGDALVLLGRVAVVKEAYDEAQRRLQQALAVYRDVGALADVGWSHAALAHAARGLAEPAQMRRHLREALRAAKQTGDLLLGLSVLPLAALLLADRGDVERAVELYALASRYPFVARSRWFEDVAGRHIDAVATTLPPDVAAAAEERGRARDLEAVVEELLEELKRA